MKKIFEPLFQPIQVGSLTLKNRFVMPAMNSHFADNDHHFTQQALNYYGERSKGGFGLLITEFVCMSEEGLAGPDQAAIYDDCFIPTLARLTERVHQNDGRIFCQLQHSGRRQSPMATTLPPVAPSNIPEVMGLRELHALTMEEIKELIRKYGDAAVRAKAAGFDGVEIHGAHRYLLAQFLSPASNKRVDQYGGSTFNRARIVCEIIEEVKKRCGADYPVSVRISVESFENGSTVEELSAQSMLFEQAGADLLNVSYDEAIQSYYTPAGFNIDNVSRIKRAVSIPVIGVGRINDPILALSAVKTGSMDLVALGRQSICDPHFPKKIAEDRMNEILSCTGCTQRCLFGQFFEEGYGISCMLNPFSGKEGIWKIEPAERPKKIAVIGAGPAGLQAAWVLAKRGHSVTVYEKESVAGGQYRLASIPPMKQNLAKGIYTYLEFCKKYGVEIKYNTEVTPELLEEHSYEEIVLATGALPVVPSIPGIKGSTVCLAQDVLLNKQRFAGKNLIVLGAGLVGAETAEYLTGYNNHVTLVDMIDQISPLAPFNVRRGLVARLNEKGVIFLPGSKVCEIYEDGILYEKEGEKKELKGFDGIVLAFGARSNQALLQALDPDKYSIHSIGDVKKAGDAKKAIFEATELALTL